MKRAMLSQPMAGKTDEEIVATREKAIEVLKEKGYEIVNTLFTDEWYSNESMKERGVVQSPLCFLAKSLENMSARTNENGIWSFSTYELDENNNPTGVVLNDTDINGVLKGMERFKKPNFEEFKKTFILNNPLDKTKIQSGFTTTTNEKITEEQKERARLAGIALSKNDDEMYQLWLDRTGKKKREFTEEDRQMAAGAFTEDLISGWKETYEKDIDQSGALAREKSNKEEKEKKVTTAVVETPPQFTGAGIVPRDGYKTISVTGSKPIPSVTGTRVVKYKSGETSNVEETFSNATLNAYTVVSKPDGERAIAALIDYPDIKSSTLKKEAARLQLQVDDNNSSAKEKQTAQLELDRIYKGSENKQAVVYLTESDAIKYGIQMGHEDANKMKDAAGSEPEKEEETPQQRIERLKKAKGLK